MLREGMIMCLRKIQEILIAKRNKAIKPALNVAQISSSDPKVVS